MMGVFKDCMEKNLEDDAGDMLGVHSQGDCDFGVIKATIKKAILLHNALNRDKTKDLVMIALGMIHSGVRFRSWELIQLAP
ncbi:hypothetical protein Tco_1358303, partial [Tanacetum coccineum]